MSPERSIATPYVPRPSRTNRYVWPRLIWSHCFCSGLGTHETLCAPFNSGVSVFPSPMKFLISSPTGFQSQMIWGLTSWCQTAIRSLMLGSEISLLWGNFCNIIIFQLVGFPPGWYVVWLYWNCFLLTHLFVCVCVFFFFFLSLLRSHVSRVQLCSTP